MATTTAPAHTTESEEEAAFRNKVREFFDANSKRRVVRKPGEVEEDLPSGMSVGEDTVVKAKQFQKKLQEAGLAGIMIPKEYGGAGLAAKFQRIFNEVAAQYENPSTAVFQIGLGMCVPTILHHGTEEQKNKFLKKSLSGEIIWSQLFSEPGAGSDVASLQTRAVRDGDEFVINGQKVWTSGAQRSDYGIIIVRTDVDVPKHQGISMFIFDMKAKGVQVRPLKQITGDSSFNEVFFDDVRVPTENLVGELNGGWNAAITMLMNERVAIGAGGGGGRRVSGESLVKLAKDLGVGDDSVVRQKLMDIWIDSRLLQFVGQRIQAALKAGLPPGPEGSIAKLAGALLTKKIGDVSVSISGPAGVAWSLDSKGGRWAQIVVGAPASSIAGGTNEIMLNIIGERVLGLPKEPQVDRDVPFSTLKVGTQPS